MIGPDFAAQVDMKTLIIIEGDMSRAVHQEAMAWAAANRDRLVAEWNRMNPDLPFSL